MRKPMSLFRRAVPVLAILGAALSTLPAQAGGVQWSVGINLPIPGVVVYPAPPQVAYAQPPVYVQQARPVYAPAPQVVYVEPPRHHRHHRHHRHWREDEYRQDWRYGR